MFQNVTVDGKTSVLCDSVADCKDLAFSVAIATKKYNSATQKNQYKVTSSIKHLFDYTNDKNFDFISFALFFMMPQFPLLFPALPVDLGLLL